MELLDGEQVIATFSVAVGKGGSGPKKMEGDLVTPVGKYKVTKHEPSHLRIFLRLDYPNADDRARFEELKKNGTIPKNATIGGEIGIPRRTAGSEAVQEGRLPEPRLRGPRGRRDRSGLEDGPRRHPRRNRGLGVS